MASVEQRFKSPVHLRWALYGFSTTYIVMDNDSRSPLPTGLLLSHKGDEKNSVSGTHSLEWTGTGFRLNEKEIKNRTQAAI